MEKIFINERIKELRKALKLNQAEFGERIGLKQGAISWIEQEGNTVTDQNIKLICEKFNVRREWLTEGAGEMLQVTEDTLFSAFARRYQLTKAEQNVARYLLQLSTEERQSILQHILSIADAARSASESASTIDEKVEAYRAELEAEEKAKERSSASPAAEESA